MTPPPPLTPAALRALFPALAETVWLNAAASSPVCRPVADAMLAHVEETVRSGDLGFPRWLAFKEALRERVARFIGAASPRELAFTPSTSAGFAFVAERLQARGIHEVLSVEGEFPSTTVPLLARGLTVRAARRRPDGSTPIDELEAALTPRTGAIAVSAVQYASGYRVDLQRLAELCRTRRLALCLNAAQALGQLPIDVTALGASFLCATSHKWLFAGYGAGLLYARQDWTDDAPSPRSAGWLSVPPEALWQTFPARERSDDALGFTVRGASTRGDATAAELGTHAFTPLYALGAALELHEALGPGTAPRHIQRLQAVLRAGLRERGFHPNAVDQGEAGSGICVVPVAGSPDDAVRRLLREARIATTARGGGLRLATHVFNDEADVHALLLALDTLRLAPAPGTPR